MKDPSGTKQLTCSGKTGTTVIAAAVKALADFKNPYDTSKKALTHGGGVSNEVKNLFKNLIIVFFLISSSALAEITYREILDNPTDQQE